MKAIYSILIQLAYGIIKLIAIWNPKMKRFVQGRRDVINTLTKSLTKEDKTLWMHCASLGEFEQGVPVLEAFKKENPSTKIVVTFFSPSGYDNKKNTPLADVVVYLPWDSPKNVKQFLDLVKPSMAFFVKYEFWPNYLYELKKQNIPTYLISGVFRENQAFFKPYGGFMKNALHVFSHFFVQDAASEELLQKIGFSNVSISGDTRFDRVSHQIEIDNSIPFIQKFKQNCLLVVCGSTWPEDIKVLLPFINQAPDTVKFLIAPHKLEKEKIQSLQNEIKKKTICYSQMKESDTLEEQQVFIMDTIGLLTKAYSYADIAYVGGAMGSTGLHNILEPATFGVPIIIGKNFDTFPEAQKLQKLAGLFSVASEKECNEILLKLTEDSAFRKATGMICGHFINSNTGATQHIMNFIKKRPFQ